MYLSGSISDGMIPYPWGSGTYPGPCAGLASGGGRKHEVISRSVIETTLETTKIILFPQWGTYDLIFARIFKKSAARLWIVPDQVPAGCRLKSIFQIWPGNHRIWITFRRISICRCVRDHRGRNLRMHYLIKLVVPALLLCVLYSFRQKENSISERAGIAYYHFSHVRDTTQSRKWEEDFQLAFGPRQSVYLSATKRRQDSMHRAVFEEAERSNSTTINMGAWRPVTEESVYINEQALLVNRSFRRADYLIQEPLEVTAWQISTETKQLLGHTCQKATGNVKGRTYTAWFTTDIPVSFGPWKLYGLPGLILEAYDNANRIRFTCTRIETDIALPEGLSLNPPADATPTTNAAFLRMEAAYREGLQANAGNSDDITVDNATVNGQQMKVANNKPQFNYPLELTTKK